MLRRNGKRKISFKRIMSQWMAIALTVATILSVAPHASYADATLPDLTPPAFTGAESSDGSWVRLYFDEPFALNTPDGATEDQVDDFLKSKISVAADGVNFTPFLDQSGYSVAYKSNSTQLYLSYDYNMKIVAGPNTVIKIAANTLKDEAGNLNAELVLPVSPPVIQSAAVSNEGHDVTIAFNKDVFDYTDGDLADYIYLIKGSNTDWNSLNEGDTASIESGKLQIHFATALSGLNYQIVLEGGAVKDQYGNVQTDDRATPLIQGSGEPEDVTAPVFKGFYLSNNNKDLNLVFDEDVLNAMVDDTSFLQNAQWYDSSIGRWQGGSPSNTAVTFSGHIATIHYAQEIPQRLNHFVFYNDGFKDKAGNVLTNNVDTSNFYPQNLNFTFNYAYISHDGRWLSLQFNTYTNQIVDQTVVDGVSHLKEQIQISTDQGATYSALSALDDVSIQGSKINIILHNAIKGGSFKVKLAENAVSDQFNTYQNSAVDIEVAYNTPDITGYVLSNTASEFVYADNAAWRTKVQSIEVYDRETGLYRQLIRSEYVLSEGKLTIAKGVFQEGHLYEIYVDAEGYSTKYFEGQAYKSSELFYTTAPVVTAENGITAKINLLSNAYDYGTVGNQSVVFELFNVTTPVSIVAAHLKLGTGTYSANFSVSDAATNPNYTVKAFVVSKYDADLANVGINLSTVKTQLEFERAAMTADNNNNNEG